MALGGGYWFRGRGTGLSDFMRPIINTKRIEIFPFVAAAHERGGAAPIFKDTVRRVFFDFEEERVNKARDDDARGLHANPNNGHAFAVTFAFLHQLETDSFFARKD